MTKLVAAVVGVLGIAVALVVAAEPGSSPGRGPGASALADAPTATPPTTARLDEGRRPEPAPPHTTTTTTAPPPPRPDSPGGDIEHAWYGSGPRVAVLGDSLTVQARRHLRWFVAGEFALKVGALFGEGMSGGLLSDNIGSPIMQAVVDEYAADPPDVVVLALGTNDVWQAGLGPVAFEQAWHHATRQFPDACIVGVTVTETDQAARYDPDDARQVNRVIRRTADVVADWAERGRAERFTGSDHIHLSEPGRQHFAELVVAGIRDCVEQRSA